MKKIDFSSLDPMALSFMKIALFAVVFIIVMVIVLVIVNRSGKFKVLFAAQQEERDYKKELQEIVNKYPAQMKGLDWIFADNYEIVNFRRREDTIYCRYRSYIVGFGGNHMVLIPVNVRGKTISNSEPMLLTPENIIRFSAARGHNTVSLTGLEWNNIQKISLNGRKHITGRTVIYVEGMPHPVIFCQMNKTNKIVTLLDLAVYNNIESPDTENSERMSLRELYSSKAAVEQTEENSKFDVFIQEFKETIKAQYPQKIIKIKILNLLVYFGFELIILGIIGFSVFKIIEKFLLKR
jgi:hypothetical protein